MVKRPQKSSKPALFSGQEDDPSKLIETYYFKRAILVYIYEFSAN